jgi:ATP-dependent RNA helicase DeaD
MSETISFASLGVPAVLVDTLAQQSITQPTPVQTAVLQADKPDSDLIVQARTGSGKTLAFGLTFLSGMDPETLKPQAIVITPTRELATQVFLALRPLAQALGLRAETLTGGADMVAQLRGLRAGAQLLIGTPGRIVDHLNRGSLQTEHLSTIVLDEGDQMLDLGFKDELEAILAALPEERRTLLFSATMPEEMRQIAKRYMKHPETITLEGTNVQHADIEHVAVRIPKTNKFEALINLLRLATRERTMLFCRTKLDTEEVCRRLVVEGFSAGFLHGDLEQRERNRVLASFRHGRLQILVATEVAARGIDVPGVSHVVNVDLPFNIEAYVHRSGRTGRAGSKGVCYSLISASDQRHFRRMMAEGKITFHWQDTPTPAAIRKANVARLRETLQLQTQTAEPDEAALTLAQELLEGKEPADVLARIIANQLPDEEQSGYDLSKAIDKDWGDDRFRTVGAEKPFSKAKTGAKFGGPRDTAHDGNFARFRVNLGHRDHMHPGKLVGMLCDLGGINGRQIGAIRIAHDHTFFEVQTDVAKSFLNKVSDSANNKGRMRVEAVTDHSPMPSSTRPKRAFHGIKRPSTRK